MPLVDKHAPVKKLHVRPNRTLWIDDELHNCMVQINDVKEVANKSGGSDDWLT
jgi:hypothetical protein